MKPYVSLLSAAVFASAFATASADAAEEYVIDAGHSHVGFTVAHLVVTKTKGQFNTFEGKLSLDPKNVEKSKVSVKIDAASIDTNDEKRDGHLKSLDFFGVKKHPTITFESTAVKRAKNGQLEVRGDLTMRGVTKPVTLQVDGPTDVVKDPWGNTRRGVSATAKIDRTAFGLEWNKSLETGGLLVGNEVTITIEAELIKK
jgi:polyisoprenoid-binding protein YceI